MMMFFLPQLMMSLHIWPNALNVQFSPFYQKQGVSKHFVTLDGYLDLRILG